MDPFFHTGLSISDSLKTVRKSVLIYETIIRPYQYGNHKKLNLKEGTVTATFKNVPKGTWVVGMHAFNRTSEDGKKVFSPWSNLKKATVK